MLNNIFDAIPENIDSEIFEQLVSNDKVKIERIISKGQRSPEAGWYDQNENEWVMVLQGEAILCFENESSLKLKAGDYINIPAHTKHRVGWTTPSVETIWLAVHY